MGLMGSLLACGPNSATEPRGTVQAASNNNVVISVQTVFVSASTMTDEKSCSTLHSRPCEQLGGSQLMPLIQVLEVLIVVGVLLWLVNRFIPMAASIKSILNAVVVIGVVLWLMNAFGLFHSISRIRIGKG